MGQLFGKNDDWNTKESLLVFHDKSEVLRLFKNFQILEFVEEEKEGMTAAGIPKFWHVFHVIARKNS